jgi:hypothetical protein
MGLTGSGSFRRLGGEVTPHVAGVAYRMDDFALRRTADIFSDCAFQAASDVF